MTHTQPKSRPRAGLLVAALATMLAVPVTAPAKTVEVVIRAPGAAEAGSRLTLNETTETIAGSLLAYVARIDGVTRDYNACLETAARLNGAETKNEKRACAVALQGAKIDMLEDLQDTMAVTAREFYALAERIKQVIDETGRDIAGSQARIGNIEAEIALLKTSGRTFYASLSRDGLTASQRAKIRQILRETRLAGISKRRLTKDLTALQRKQDWLTDGKTRIEVWAETVGETGKDLDEPIMLAEEIIEDINRLADWEALVSGSTGVPATLNGLNDVFGEVRRFNDESNAMDVIEGAAGVMAGTEMPEPNVMDDAALYDSFAELFQEEETEVRQ